LDIINTIKAKHYERFCDGEIDCHHAY
jgi:hypothetical protein